MHLKLHFITISGISPHHHYAPEDYVDGQDIFETFFLSPNHEQAS